MLRARTRDVDGDGRPELVAYLEVPEDGHDDALDKATVLVFGLRPDGEVARMTAVEQALMGVVDEADLDRELPRLGTLGPTDVALERLVVRLPWASAGELRALVASRGIDVCRRHAEKRTCKHHPRRAIDARLTKVVTSAPGRFAKLANDREVDLEAPWCNPDEDRPSRVTCTASVGGPAGGSWVFDRTPAGLRLVEVGSWSEDS